MERKTRKHKHYTIKEKNDIVKLYFEGALGGYLQLSKIYDASTSMIRRWVRQYETYGTCVDHRGQGGTGRPRKHDRDYESMSKKDLIKHIKMVEDIKKVTAYLRKQKKNTK